VGRGGRLGGGLNGSVGVDGGGNGWESAGTRGRANGQTVSSNSEPMGATRN
jgi:hypothetical protein